MVLDGDGIETMGMYKGRVFFDIKNSGFANRIGWIKADDGQLALDRNGNGKIDNITELFGDYRMSAWDELKLLDSNNNGKIDLGYGDLPSLHIELSKDDGLMDLLRSFSKLPKAHFANDNIAAWNIIKAA